MRAISKSNLAVRRFTYWGKTLTYPETAPWTEVTSLTTGVTSQGYSNPEYARQIKEGVSATTSYTKEVTYYRRSPGQIMVRGKSGNTKNIIGKSTTVGLYPSLITARDYATVTADAEQKSAMILLKKIRKEQASWGGGQFLAEFHKTVSMMKRPAKTLRDGIDVFYSTHFKWLKGKAYNANPVTLNRALADTYFEWVFGVRPLISEISAIADAATAYFPSEIKRITAKSLSATCTSTTGANGVANLSATSSWSEDLTVLAESKRVCGLRRQLLGDLNQFEKVKALGGFDLRSVVPTVWELVPHSWLIDYFVNVGQLLEASAACTADVAWWSSTLACSTTRRRHSLKATNTWSSGQDITSFTPPSDFTSKQTIKRTASAVTVSSLTFGLPGRDTSWINIGALITQRSKWAELAYLRGLRYR